MPGFFKSIGNFFTGTPEKRENVSTLRPEQEGLYQQAINAGMGRGAGGAFGSASDYYRDLLSNESPDYDAFAAPAMRQYNQDIVPGISEQFAGMGAGGSGLSGSGFRNAQVQGGVDLAERLGSLRANLRQAGAQGLQNIGQVGLQNYSQNMVTEPGTPGFLSNISSAFGGGLGTALGRSSGNWFGGNGNQVAAKTGPYGPGGPQASPVASGARSGLQLPDSFQGQRGY